MKVGIISINAHTKVLNFASPLHSYAFWSFLNEYGIEAKIIDYKPIYYRKYNPKYPLFYYIDHPRKTEEEQREYLKKWKNLFWEREKRYQRFQEFIDKYYVKTKRCYNEKTLDQKKFGFDCYICATDVIWKWNKGYGFDRGFFLACGCMKGKRKIAYAASRGASQYTPEQEAEFKTYLRDFDYISVREKSLKDYCETLTDQRVTQVLDPVFLKSREFYEDLAIEPKEKGYVLIYIVMEKAPSLVTAAVNFAKAHNLEVIELSELLEDRTIPEGTRHEIVYGIGVEEWLGYMQHAEYIFTNSFHACCFSIILHKKFWAGKRAGDKVDSVLGLMGLTNRRLGPDCEDGTFADEPIDWDEVESRKETYRRQSAEYILNAIHGIPEEPRKPGEARQTGANQADKENKQEAQPDQAETEKRQETQKTGSIWKKNSGCGKKIERFAMGGCNTANMDKILLVEDDKEISSMLKNFLVTEHYEVVTAFDGKSACGKFFSDSYSLVLLDLMIPKMSGMAVMEKIRKSHTVPIIILSAKDTDSDKTLGLGLGADDYITKPFSVTEVLARIKANIRRSTQYAAGDAKQPEILQKGSLVMNLSDYSVIKNGARIELTAKEFDILKLLMQNPQKVYTKEQIYSQVWKDAYLGDQNAVNVHISRLRNKIEDQPKDPRYIITLWGIGYKLGDTADA